ncbi:MAG: AAA family ATPase [Pseudomonadales bacterium]
MAEGERSFLGLTHNPFVEPFRGFFERGGRKTHLEQLRHLSQWSRRVLLVTGPQGVGKTTLYRELAATLEPRVKAARISAGLVNTGREVLAAIAQGFGMATSAAANSQALRLDLIAHVEAQASGDRPCLVLVDDAQLLDNRAVEELMTVARDSALHLVLFGEVRMVPVIERLASSRGVGWQEIRLSAYGEGDARDYLEWRFQQARYRGRIPFTDQQVKELAKLSGGLPGRINQMANVLLVKLESGEVSARPAGFPRQHLALLGALVIVVGVLYVLFTDRPARVDTVALSLPPSSEASAERPGEPVEGDVQADAAAEIGTTDQPIPEPGPEAASPSQEETAAAVEPVLEESAPPASEPRPAEMPAAAMAAPDDVEQPRPAAAVPRARVETATTPKPAPAPASVEPPPSSRAEPAPAASGVRDARWLLRQNPDYFTLQLVTVSALERAQAFVAKQKEPGEFAVYQLQRDGRVLHVVIYGMFSTREAAQRAADNLPPEVGDVRPWIRPVGQVQDAARISTLQ